MSKMNKMAMTKRDVDILNWINGLGFVDVNQIARRYNISIYTAYARLRKLVSNNLLCHERLIHNQPGHYFVTKQGAAFSPIGLSAIRHIPMGSYRHTKSSVELSMVLAKKHNARFIPERELRHDAEQDGVGNFGHMSDGVLVIGEEKIAIEVELSTKCRRRLKRILGHYASDFDLKEAWYFCGNQAVKNLIQKNAEPYKCIKVHLLSDWVV